MSDRDSTDGMRWSPEGHRERFEKITVIEAE
jgi:hypothetical protein